MAIKWSTAKPHREWVIVKADERVKKTAGGIILPDAMTGAERVMEGTGKLLRVGSAAREAVNFALEPGMRIVFRGFLKDAWRDLFEPEDGCDVFLLSAKDILAVVEDDSTAFGFMSSYKAGA